MPHQPCVQGQVTQQIAAGFQAFPGAPGVHRHQTARQRGVHAGSRQIGEVSEEEYLPNGCRQYCVCLLYTSIKADVLVSLALIASVAIGEDFAAGEVA